MRSVSTRDSGTVCVVAILKHEGRFVEEWLAYHRLIGVEHFFLYDNDPELPLRRQLEGHDDVTVVDWVGEHEHLPGRNKQTKAYTDAVERVRHQWVAIIDVDEFIVLRKHQTLPQFLAGFDDVSAVRLTWHQFGHNGHDDDPEGLLTSALTRRRARPGRMTKSITRVDAIASIESAHHCDLLLGRIAVDANKRPYQEALYPGKTDVAHVNHYLCRSFRNWMHRLERGEAAFSSARPPRDPEHLWRFDREACLRRFHEIAKDHNEMVDEFMLGYAERIEAGIRAHRRHPEPMSR